MKQGHERNGKRSIVYHAAICGFWLLVWQLLALWVDNEILLVTPVQTAKTLLVLAGNPSFGKTIAVSVGRIGAGFFLGSVTALLLALVSSRLRIVEDVLAPVMTLCKAVPVASFVVLLLIWWGSSYLAVAVSFVMVLPNVYISTLEGLKSTDRKLLEMSQVFAVSFWGRFYYIYRPALKPFIYSSLKLSLGMCWKSGVAAEVIGTPDFSIGEKLYLSKIYLDTAGVFAWTVVIILLSIGFEKIVLQLVECFFSWEPAVRSPKWAEERQKRIKGGQKAGSRQKASEEGQKTGSRQKASEEGQKTGSRRKTPVGVQEAVIRVRHVYKSYAEKSVLCNVSAEYKSNQVYYLNSPSGSGKTTLLRLLCGLEQPQRGEITEESPLGIPGQTKRFLRYSMVFQEDRLCEEYSAVRNVELVCGNRKGAQEALLQLLPQDALKKPCSRLSGGMKRRVALVRAMESASDVVLLDEPFTGMDIATRKRAEEYIQKRQQGRVLIIATHI